jgi:hypothetical protein
MNQQTLIKFSSRTFGSSSRGKSINPTADSRILGSQGSSIPVPFRFLGSANKRRTTPRSRDWKQTLTAIRNFFGSLKCHKTCEEHAVAAVRFALQLLHAWSRECVFFHTKRQFGTSTWITWGLMAWCCKSAEECRDSTSRCLNPIDFFQVSELFVSAQCWPHRPDIYSMYSQYVSYWVIFPLFGFGSRVTVTAPRKQTVCVCY